MKRNLTMLGVKWFVMITGVVCISFAQAAQNAASQDKGDGYTLHSDEKVAEDSGRTIWKSLHGGYLFFAGSVTDILPPNELDNSAWPFKSHFVLKQHDDNLIAAYFDKSDKTQVIYWHLNLSFDKNGNIKMNQNVPIWTDGNIHEFEGSVTLGAVNKKYTFYSNPGQRLVFTVSRERGYIHQSGSGTLTFPDGKVVKFGSEDKGYVVGTPNSKRAGDYLSAEELKNLKKITETK